MPALKQPHVIALASGVLFGLATPASKVLVGDIGPFLLAGLLYLGAALAMLPMLRGTSLRPVGRDRARLLGAIVCGGILGPVFLLFGLQLAMASSVSVWLNLELVWTALLGVLVFQERSSRWSWLAVALVVAAGILLAWSEQVAGILPGILVAAACLAWGLDNHLTARIQTIPATSMTWWKGLVGGSVNLLIGFALGGSATGLGVLGALGVGIVCYGISITLYVVSARRIGATRAQVMFSTAPLWGILAATLVLGEAWTPRLAVATVLVSAAIACLALDTRQAPGSAVAQPL